MVKQFTHTLISYEERIKNETAAFIRPRQRTKYLRDLYREAPKVNKKSIVSITLHYFPHLLTVVKTRKFLTRIYNKK